MRRLDKAFKFAILYVFLQLFYGPLPSARRAISFYVNLSKHVDDIYDLLGIDLDEIFARTLSKLSSDYRIKAIVKKLLNAQSNSLKQFYVTDKEFLEDVTEKKGGYAMQFLLLMAKPGATEEELELAYDLGYLGQLIEDYLDVYEDKLLGIHTLFTEGYYGYKDVLRVADEIIAKWGGRVKPIAIRGLRIFLRVLRFPHAVKVVVGALASPAPLNIMSLNFLLSSM